MWIMLRIVLYVGRTCQLRAQQAGRDVAMYVTYASRPYMCQESAGRTGRTHMDTVCCDVCSVLCMQCIVMYVVCCACSVL
jgi:hypothetical protein